MYKEFLALPKIDVHTHIGVGGQKRTDREVEEYLEDSHALGIEKIFLSRPFSGIGSKVRDLESIERANSRVVELVERHPGLVYGYAFVHAGHFSWSLSEMDRCMACPGMVGIKLYHQYFFDDPVVVRLVREAAERQALVLLHQGKFNEPDPRKHQPMVSNGVHIAALAEQVPGAHIIAGHIGGGGDWEWTIKAVRDADSVYFDTSGTVIDAGIVDFTASELGVDRLLFATDMSLPEGVGKILASRLSDSAKRKIFAGNAMRLLEEIGR
jgi:predicted TIM-barrel fold metal-dependent hydrolase